MNLTTRIWNDTAIARRSTDGYLNATAMCKANGKEWKHYFETDRAHKYLAALERSVGIPTDRLFQSITTGSNEGRGTWVHPQLAVDLARWISPEFAVWMDGWLIASFEAKQPAPETHESHAQRLSGQELVNLAERSMALMERLGGMDQRDELLFRDIIRTNLLTASTGSVPALPQDREITLSDAWLQVYGSPLPRNQYSPLGSRLAKLYREEHGEAPLKREQFVDGALRLVNSYRTSWLITALQRVKAIR